MQFPAYQGTEGKLQRILQYIISSKFFNLILSFNASTFNTHYLLIGSPILLLLFSSRDPSFQTSRSKSLASAHMPQTDSYETYPT